VCDSFVELPVEQETGNNKEAERKLADLWAQQGGDPFYLQETKDKWKAGTNEEKQLEESSVSSSSFFFFLYARKRKEKETEEAGEKGGA
jgi:hypothetical protein